MFLIYFKGQKNRGGLKVSAKIINSTLDSQEDIDKFYGIFNPITHYSFIEEEEDIWPEYDFEKNPSAILVSQDRKAANICTFPLEYMVIYVNGDVGACCVDWKHATVYGNIQKQTITEVWNSKKLRDFQLMHLKGKRKLLDFCKYCNNPSMDNVDGKEELIIEKLENMNDKD